MIDRRPGDPQGLQIRGDYERSYRDVYTPEALAALATLAPLNEPRRVDGFEWGSNPYIETNMARGNCVGCHQGSTESFLPTTLARQRSYNISDFSFSFASNRAAFRSVIQEQLRKRGLKSGVIKRDDKIKVLPRRTPK